MESDSTIIITSNEQASTNPIENRNWKKIYPIIDLQEVIFNNRDLRNLICTINKGNDEMYERIILNCN